MTTSALNIASIIRSAGTQFRANMNTENVEDMMSLIQQGVSFKSPIRVAVCDDHYYLVDGFHRLEAYERLRMTEIPAGQYMLVPASSIEEVRLLAMGANVLHGKGNSRADYYIIIKKMMELDEGKYMKNAFEPDIKKIAEAIGAARSAVMRGYNDYFGTESEPHPALSVQLKEKRDAAILEKHKEGMSNRAIAKLFKMGSSTVDEVVSKEAPENPESGKSGTPEVSASTVPMASTEDRSETRASSSFVNEQLEELLGPDYLDIDGNAAYSLSEDEADAPSARFDVLAATGYSEDLCQYTKPSKPANEYEQVEAAKANPVKLQERWMDLCDQRKAQEAKRAAILKMLAEVDAEIAITDQQQVEVQRIATQSGVALPE